MGFGSYTPGFGRASWTVGAIGKNDDLVPIIVGAQAGLVSQPGAPTKTVKVMKNTCREQCRTMRFQMFEMDALAAQSEAQGRDVIRLAVGISQEPTPETVVSAICRALTDKSHSQEVLPFGLPELREKIALHYSTLAKSRWETGDVYVAPGTSSLYVRLFPLLLEPGDRVLLPRPYYPLYLYASFLASAIPRFYDIDPSTGALDLDTLEDIVRAERPRLMLINSPGNPIGNILLPAQLERLAELAQRHQTFLWSDETYGNMDFTGAWRSLASVGFNPETTLITNGFSKGYRMYQRRVGYCLTKSRVVKELLESALQNTVLTADPAAQHGALEALAHPEYVLELRELYRQRAQQLLGALNAKRVEAIPPRGGFNALLDCRQALRAARFKNSVELAQDILNQTFVAVTPGVDFGIEGYLRLTLTNQRFPEAVNRLNAYFKALPDEK